MLFYKISSTVKLALLELRRFGLAGQYSQRGLPKKSTFFYLLYSTIRNFSIFLI